MRVELRGITKRFPGVLANQCVDLTVEAGEVHALLGENGSGKSTLMNVLFGLLRPDEGQILIDGEPIRFRSPASAIASGIGMVHQQFMLVPAFTVAENMQLGYETTSRFGRLDMDRTRQRVREMSREYGFDIDPDSRVEELPLGAQQRVEILKALYRDTSLLILDEPTSVLGPSEVSELETIIRKLGDSGRSVVFISHKLGEVMRVADRITILRDGEVVGSKLPAETDEKQLAKMMVGRPLQILTERTRSPIGKTRLVVDQLVVTDDRGLVAVDDVSFEVRSGEILGIAGVQGNGQTQLVEALTGLRSPTRGTVRLDGVNITGSGAAELFRSGVGHIPEDRNKHGVVGEFSIAENLILNEFSDTRFSKRGGLRREAIRCNANELQGEFDIRAPSVDVPVSSLSGGNQQKVVLARELGHASKLLVAAQPTRGLDVGSTDYVRRRIIAERDRGASVVLVSSELDEVMALADRVAVMVEGKLAAVIDCDATSREDLGQLMGGSIINSEPSTSRRHPGSEVDLA